MTAAPEHAYTSTACQHDLHEKCRRTCKYCQAACRCDCHQCSTATCPRCGGLVPRRPRYEVVLHRCGTNVFRPEESR